MVTYYLWRSIVIRGEVEDTRLEAKAKDTKKFQGQGQGPRTQAQVFSKKKVFKKFFSGDLHLRKTKKDLRKVSAKFLAFFNKISTVQKIVLSSSRGQSNFRGLEASRPRPRTSKCVLEAKDVLEDSTSDSNYNTLNRFS